MVSCCGEPASCRRFLQDGVTSFASVCPEGRDLRGVRAMAVVAATDGTPRQLDGSPCRRAPPRAIQVDEVHFRQRQRLVDVDEHPSERDHFQPIATRLPWQSLRLQTAGQRLIDHLFERLAGFVSDLLQTNPSHPPAEPRLLITRLDAEGLTRWVACATNVAGR